MLKRFWFVLSILWTGFWVMIGFAGKDFFNAGYIGWCLMPWFVGVIILIAWRFIVAARAPQRY